MPHIREGENVYYEDDKIKQLIGPVSKTEIQRLDAETVADVLFTFDLSNGHYVEVSRTTRAEPMPPLPPSPDEQIKVLDERTVGMQAIDDFTLQAQATIDERTVGMQEIDDFTLLQVVDLQQQVDQLKADIALLKGGA